MMMSRFAVVFCVSFGLTLFGGAGVFSLGGDEVRADIAPPFGYVERCKASNFRRKGLVCVYCRTYFRYPKKCVRLYEPRGFTQRCRTRGASVWGEVWCGQKAAMGKKKAVKSLLGKKLLPQADPFVLVLRALLKGDLQLFKRSFSKRVLKKPSSRAFEKNLKEGQKRFGKAFGKYRVSDFTFLYRGDGTKGVLHIVFKGKKKLRMRVVLEGKEWKLDEH